MSTVEQGLSLTEKHGVVVVPAARYNSREFFDLEMEKLWPRIWQVACREEEIPTPGDYLEYTLGDQSVLVVRSEADTIRAFFNACPHRGTRLAKETGTFSTSEIRCPYHAWRFDLGGANIEVVDRQDYPPTLEDDDVCLGPVKVGRWGGFVFINMDPDSEPLETFLGSVPELYSSYRFENLRFRSYRTIVFECNWKTAVDAFNEAYHPQGLHPQMLAWFDDTGFEYTTFGLHSSYQKREDAPALGPSPRLGLEPEDLDERELLAARVDATAGLFPRADREYLHQLVDTGLPPGKTITQVFGELRMKNMRARGIDLDGLTAEEIMKGGTIHVFPNLLGPIAHGNATLYRARPNGLDPDSTLLDYWALEWIPAGEPAPPLERQFYEDWSTKDWGLINNQDFGNFVEISRGMASRGFKGALLNPVQEANLIHHQQVIDRYVFD